MLYFYGYGVKEFVIGEIDVTHEVMRNMYKISMGKPKGKK
jgi:hypothetical protein